MSTPRTDGNRELALFDMEPVPAPEPEPAEKLTAGQRRRRKQEDLIRVGLHPLSYLATGLRTIEHPVTETTPTCGTCVFRELVHGGNRSFPKCLRGYSRTEISEAERALSTLGKWGPRHRIVQPYVTHGEASDVRAWWPGCQFHQPKEDP